MPDESPPPAGENEFAKLRSEKQPTLFREFVIFIRENKAYWMIPIVITLGIIGLLAALSATGAAPFIYTLF